MERCFACDREMTASPKVVWTSDDSRVYVGPDCFYRTLESREAGYQPPKGGPRLFALQFRPAEAA